MQLKSLLTIACLVLASAYGSHVHHAAEDGAPLISSLDADVIPDSYIVVFKKDAPASSLMNHFTRLNSLIDLANIRGNDENELKHVYNMEKLKGYAGKFSPNVLEKIRESEDVAYVEKDSVVYTTELQRNAPWGLARVSHREPLGFRTFNKYLYEKGAGEGVTVYVVDTGVNVDHIDFEGRAKWGATIPQGDKDIDGNGHGTHVAGTIAGKRYGVAKKAEVVAVKVLRSNGSGSMSDVVKGVEWTVGSHLQSIQDSLKSGETPRGSVANMSLGGGMSRTLNEAVDAAVDHGVMFAVAAGNDNRDACDYSPASSEKAITVGASSIADERAYFSNYGKCVDVFAPGKDITSTWIGSKVATNTISGTSMASPHVAGLAAYYLSLAPSHESVSPQHLKDKIIQTSTKDVLTQIPADTPNLLIYNSPPSNFDDL